MPIDINTTTPDHEIVASRILNFPRTLVYRAWTEPEHLKNWWGPNGFTNTFNEFDFRVGGKWSFIMHGPEKGNYANEVEFTQIEPLSFLLWKRYSKPLFQVAVTFDEISETETKVTFRQIFDTVEECAKIKPYVVDKNEENFDRLETELSTMV
ncbi:MAG: ATPase [Flavobacterium sp.]|uniref:SRPBCC family protein n=1 Tax=Flavobacterium sp. TaxID=239 RepID=UPI001229382A|nr:SRPBCC family protein [Flavobacterium sp.]RZJ67450.1 MAG: ATPase [Flavobacterium sp.]